MGKYKVLLWDIDGTVLDFKAAQRVAIRSLFEKYGFGPCPDPMLERYSALNDRYWKALERGEMTRPQILTGRFREFFAQEGLDPEKAEAFNEDYQLALGDTIVFCDDSLTILQEEKKNYVLAAITNGTKAAQEKKLSASGLDRIFEKVFISEEVGAEKPNPEFFHTVLKEMDISDRSSVLIIGDSLTSDILGGVRMGIDTCFYDPKGNEKKPDIQPTYTIRDLHALSGILEKA